MNDVLAHPIGRSVIKTMGKSVSKRKKDADSKEAQRRWPRLKPSSVPFLKSVSFSQGGEVQIIDISRGGMLLETEVRLRPQMKIHLKLVTSNGIVNLDGTVLRLSITSLKGAPRYQSAIAFQNPFHMLDDLSEKPELVSPETQPEFSQAPAFESSELAASPVLGNNAESPAVLTLVVPDKTFLFEMFKQNDW